jgi:hypothetical protein
LERYAAFAAASAAFMETEERVAVTPDGAAPTLYERPEEMMDSMSRRWCCVGARIEDER